METTPEYKPWLDARRDCPHCGDYGEHPGWLCGECFEVWRAKSHRHTHGPAGTRMVKAKDGNTYPAYYVTSSGDCIEDWYDHIHQVEVWLGWKRDVRDTAREIAGKKRGRQVVANAG